MTKRSEITDPFSAVPRGRGQERPETQNDPSAGPHRPPDERLRELFQVSDNSTKLLCFETILTAEDEKLAYEVKRAIHTKRRPILESELKVSSLPGLIAANSNYLPVSSKKVLKLALPSKKEAEILGIDPEFVIEQTIHALELRPVG